MQLNIPRRKYQKNIIKSDRDTAFDLLFQEEKSKKVIPFKSEIKHNAYHLYFFIGVISFLLACYLITHFSKEKQIDSNVNESIKESTFDGITTVVFEGTGKEFKTQKLPPISKKIKINNQGIVKKPAEQKIKLTAKIIKISSVKHVQRNHKALSYTHMVTQRQHQQINKPKLQNTTIKKEEIKLRPLKLTPQD